MIDETELHGLLARAPGNLPATEPLDVHCLRFRVGDRSLFPAFQFDPVDRRVLPGLDRIIAAARASGLSKVRLLNWLMRTHLDFETTPAAALPAHPDDVLAAPLRELEPQERG
ncbi:hypothetical protein [Paracoccus hibiscisoli]|uniref:Uncharacterized protein n=1 Tax=Paracoccus hibiscisoli TaxID=2023261 RepID=A0A4U0Q6L7_9RHOB|nr:hypothetical protein [Paracoccus hibiscisoli]TJZ76877.1 hypothetical protein FA740_19245 [Paracoccus hibiscisoli]